MPGGHEGRAGTQVKFSDKLDWLCSRARPRPDLATVPFVGEVSGETPWTCRDAEVRRKDVGVQRYGSGTPAMNCALTDRNGLVLKKRALEVSEVPTSHGNITLRANDPDLGFLPTADAVLFLRSQYVGSRAPDPRQRFFPI